MRKKTSAIRRRNANPAATSLCEALVAHAATIKKKLQDSETNPAAHFCEFSFA
jgi:hypothetical protein